MFTSELLPFISFLSPLAFALWGIWGMMRNQQNLPAFKQWGNAIASASILIALATVALSWPYGAIQNTLFEFAGLGFTLRLDHLSSTMFVMIALLGFIVLRFSNNYLDGDARQGVFLGRLGATIAAVEMLVLSGNLGQLFVSWVLTSLCLHQLLLFYHDRKGAVVAAKKKFIVARLGDVCLLIAVVLLYSQFGTGDLATIFGNIQAGSGLSTQTEIAAVFLALAALLKAGQFPTHGWLIEVVETPTPVSALLHAGLLNAGPFLVIRMAFVMQEAFYAPLFLILFGAFTALFASVVFLTQPSVKVGLAYSSAAHMGFMLLICGFGVYTAAMLHLVAHSFYKAHAFLSSGSIIDVVRANKTALPQRKQSALRIVGSIFLATSIYAALAWLWNIDPIGEFALVATGAIILMGLSQIIAPALDSNGKPKGIMHTALLAGGVGMAFFSLEHLFHQMLQQELPAATQLHPIIIGLVILALLAFAATAILQLAFPNYPARILGTPVGIHLRNGLYANALFDRLIGALATKNSQVSIAEPPLKQTHTAKQNMQLH